MKFLEDNTSTAAQLLLGPLGARVMGAIWEHYPENEFTVRDVHTALTETGWSGKYTTILTTMERLKRAGIIERAPKRRDMHHLAASYACNYSERALIAAVCKRLTR
jgi:predicted transcriptional regulator